MRPGRRPTLRAWAEVVLIALLVFCAVLAGIQWHRAHQANSRLHAAGVVSATRQTVASTAAAVGTALFTYDYRDLAVAQNRILGFATGTFAQREAAHNAAVQRQLRDAKAIGSATVQEETVSDVSAEHATAVVVLDTKASSALGRSTTGVVYLHLDLRDVNGVWKVDDVQTLAPAS